MLPKPDNLSSVSGTHGRKSTDFQKLSSVFTCMCTIAHTTTTTHTHNSNKLDLLKLLLGRAKPRPLPYPLNTQIKRNPEVGENLPRVSLLERSDDGASIPRQLVIHHRELWGEPRLGVPIPFTRGCDIWDLLHVFGSKGAAVLHSAAGGSLQ